ncbi:hypothetical protein C1645_821730 [Glomus cerebriforme]|uniref:BTB/POZ domain-containing protein n=1 Tax=Glomus cerebriforme TaxID=658196 RepID=A0A397T0D1_9GLOM|nr:hypothetical protein C1645_821730 [Glomus cerebriforme]
MTSNFHSRLSKDLSSILKDADDYNVIIKVGKYQNTKEFRAHSVILRARSPYFKNDDWITKENNLITFNKPNIIPTVFDMVLKYIYTGELDLAKQSGEDILGLLIASHELLIEELFEHVQDHLIEKQTKWVEKNIVFVLNSVFKLEGCEKLRDYCLESICNDLKSFITSNAFTLLDKDVLFNLFKREDFQIEEIIAWDSLIKWGIKQIPELENKDDQKEWTDENYEELKNTLNEFIPLINFLDITSEDFYHKIQPYKTIIPNDIFDEIMTYYLVEQPKTYSFIQIESKIIKPKLANIISNWIDKKNPKLIRTEKKDPLYKFNLIYRGSRDGIDNDSFKNNCKGHYSSLVLIKVQQSNKIFGGYSSIGLKSIGDDFLIDSLGFQWYNSSDNFIFSFEDDQDMRNMKISRVLNNSKAILEYNTTGFNFGWDSLYMEGKNLCIYNWRGDYENNLQVGATYTIEEIETFIVTINQ